MDQPERPDPASPADDTLAGGGEMGARMRALDWSATPVGPVAGWPQSLRTAISILLASRFPMIIFWGRDLLQFYNDAYRPVLGASKHPDALGQRARDCWPEIWDIVGPMLQGVLDTGQATWSDDQLLLLDRNGYVEECYFTFSYSPIRVERGAVGGVFCAVTETTGQVLGDRRMLVLRDLASVATQDSVEQAGARATQTLEGHPDLPFALLYLLDSSGKTAHLAGAAGLPLASPLAPVDLPFGAGPTAVPPIWPLAQAAAENAAVVVDHLPAGMQRSAPPSGETPPRAALVLPVARSGQERPAGLLVAGLNPRRALDDDYRGFLGLVAGQVATVLTGARAYQETRQRAEALAELDRAKTAFFSNVSHEFRTPLTLLLGPLDDALMDRGEPLPPIQRERLSIAQRNGLRLLRLVNTLLDFSRLESGRMQAHYEPTDLAAFTADLAGGFRSAIEHARLRFSVTCRPLPEPVYVDRELWEKIVLNLLSNAFKFTLEGEIALVLRTCDQQVELVVRDTGTGIPAEELPHLFERFHRVRGTRARTQEGTGIGLALVRELVALHGGSMDVVSVPAIGSTFTVWLPRGNAHLPSDHIGAPSPFASPAQGVAPFVEEAGRWSDGAHGRWGARAWTSDSTPDAPSPDRPIARSPHARILLADDNAEMREYLARLLGRRWQIEAVADGASALAAALARPPDLVLSDIMMPEMDGFALLQALRAEERTREVPVVLLSARAGEEATVEGLDAGADDYLIKPFTARELLARVGAHLELARTRQDAAQARQQALEEAREAVRLRDEFLSNAAHDLKNPLTSIHGYAQLLQRRLSRPELPDRQRLMDGLIGIEMTVVAMQAQIDELRDLGRLPIGQPLALRVEPTDLVRLTRQAIADQLQVGAGHHIALRRHPPQLLGQWDAVRLGRVLANLLANAVKYSPESSAITVDLRREEGDGAWAVVQVRDEGLGVPAADLLRIFDRYYRAGNVGRISGSGSGLAGVRQIVEQHGGAITVESHEGQGSVFTIRLPINATESEPEG